MSRQTQAIIHADAILNNYTALTRLAPGSQAMAVIKADAYGHGAVNIARILRGHVQAFAVAITEEAIKLRENGVKEPIVVLEGPHQKKDCILASQHNLTLVLHDESQLRWVDELQLRIAIWLKVDTGMHRLGLPPAQLVSLVNTYQHLLNEQSVLVSHLACADEPDVALNTQQLARLSQLAKAVNMPVSVANSPATLSLSGSHGAWNRLGLALYGANPLHPAPSRLTLQPAMTLRASVIALRQVRAGEGVGYGQVWQAPRDSLIATVGIGYADGYPRHCPNGTPVLVRGARAALVGRVSMDMLSIDVTDIPAVALGDTVELWGEQLSVDEVASCAQTVAYELVTRVSPRVPRVVRYQ
ncbi:alanine racemase [Salinimonas sediminis]|uniref:Alanine racemase n=1 Tax=Salinimonas sediminis TaxID=2303538 RepID=A0A346NS53_9ALTE|nr:alanine racemase [Salinimonas sediminis]AXR08360.1 alanine racemase [Salinimonas sediminis]